MKTLTIENVSGGFLITRGDFIGEPTNDRSVACCVDTALAIVGAWARGETWAPPTEVPEQRFVFKMGDLVAFKDSSDEKKYGSGPYKVQFAGDHGVSLESTDGGFWVAPGSLRHVAPDAAPAPFRVGDRVVLRDWSRMVHYHNKPLVVVNKLDSGVSAIPNNGGHPVWFDFDELRHAPAEDL